MPKCSNARATSLYAQHRVPFGSFCSHTIRFYTAYQTKPHPPLQLRTLRHVPDSAPAVNFAISGNIQGLQDFNKDWPSEQNFPLSHLIVLNLHGKPLFQALTDHPTTTNQPDALGRAALDWASARGHHFAVTILLIHGVDPNLFDAQHSSPLSLSRGEKSRRLHHQTTSASAARSTARHATHATRAVAGNCYGVLRLLLLLGKGGGDGGLRLRALGLLETAARYADCETLRLLCLGVERIWLEEEPGEGCQIGVGLKEVLRQRHDWEEELSCAFADFPAIVRVKVTPEELMGQGLGLGGRLSDSDGRSGEEGSADREVTDSRAST